MFDALTYNVEYGKRLPDVYAWLEGLAQKPDIICLQEFPYEQIEVMGELNLYHRFAYHFAPAQMRRGKLYGQLTAFDASRLRSVSARSIDLGEYTLERLYRALNPSRRSALTTTFQSAHGEFTIVNIHLLAIGTNAQRRAQLARILEEMSSRPTIIMGDYNYTDLIAGDGLSRFLHAFGFQKAGDSVPTHRNRVVFHQLDYMFYSACTVTDIRVVDIPYSDHYPVFARVIL